MGKKRKRPVVVVEEDPSPQHAKQHKQRKQKHKQPEPAAAAAAPVGMPPPDAVAAPVASMMPPRPRLVRQLSGATGVRTMSPREPSPKVSPLAPASHGGYLARHGVSVHPAAGSESCRPAESFATAAGLYGAELVAAIQGHVGAPRPTPIQSACWGLAAPTAARPRPCDLIGVAETGAGKTFAFLLPAVARMQRSASMRELWERRDQSGPSMLVLAPTRELAQQIHAQLELLLAASGTAATGGERLRSVCVLGGQTVEENPELLQELFRGVEAIVATPGRLLNLLDRKRTHLRRLGQLLPSDSTGGIADECGGGVLIIDEADRMLGLGFESPIRKILAYMPQAAATGSGGVFKRPDGDDNQGRQTLLFSATWSADVEAFGAELTHNPIRVTVSAPGSGSGDGSRHIPTASALEGEGGAAAAVVAFISATPQLTVNDKVKQEVIMILSASKVSLLRTSSFTRFHYLVFYARNEDKTNRN